MKLCFLLLLSHAIAWSYSGHGSNWDDYKTCDSGKRQSPINIDTDDVVFNTRAKIAINYSDVFNPVLFTSEDSYQVWMNFSHEMGNMTYVDENDKETYYELKWMHIHAKGEHKLDGDRGSVEV